MKRLKRFLGLELTLLISLVAACRDEAELELSDPIGGGDSVEIAFVAPSCYTFGGMQTRASDTNYPQTESDYLPVNSTVWLTYQKLKTKEDGTLMTDENGDYVPDGDENTKPYVVRGLLDKILTLYACGESVTTTTDDDGTTHTWRNANPEVSGVPLYLDAGHYRFSAMSPALPITKTGDNDTYRAKVYNGVYFCASDIRYKNSYNQEFEVKVQKNGVQRVTLNPLVWQVARLNFTITHDDKVGDVDMLPDGIEVSGLQNPVNSAGENTYFNWHSNVWSDTLPMRLGDKRSWVSIPGEDCVKLSDGTITANVGVLPTNGMSTTFVLLFNLAINGIPTQYETSINKTLLYHGHMYNVKITVDGKDKVTVLPWFNQQQWTATTALN